LAPTFHWTFLDENRRKQFAVAQRYTNRSENLPLTLLVCLGIEQIDRLQQQQQQQQQQRLTSDSASNTSGASSSISWVSWRDVNNEDSNNDVNVTAEFDVTAIRCNGLRATANMGHRTRSQSSLIERRSPSADADRTDLRLNRDKGAICTHGSSTIPLLRWHEERSTAPIV
jgi:hypothetical protein